MIRLCSVGLYVYALNLGVAAISMASFAESYGVLGFILPICLLIIAVILWFFPFTALATLTKGFNLNLQVEADYEFPEIAEFLIVVLGLYLLFHVISDAAYWILVSQFTAASDYPVKLTPDQKAMIGATVVEAILVFGLILGRRGIIQVLHNLRFGGAK